MGPSSSGGNRWTPRRKKNRGALPLDAFMSSYVVLRLFKATWTLDNQLCD